jgi:hypothetical protein
VLSEDEDELTANGAMASDSDVEPSGSNREGSDGNESEEEDPAAKVPHRKHSGKVQVGKSRGVGKRKPGPKPSSGVKKSGSEGKKGLSSGGKKRNVKGGPTGPRGLRPSKKRKQ